MPDTPPATPPSSPPKRKGRRKAASPARLLPKGKASGLIEGKLADTLIGEGKRPAVDPVREYIAGGGGSLPLVSQQVLGRGVDDLARDLGMHVYEAMLNDSTVSAALHILITGVLSGEFQLLPALRAEDTEAVAPGSARAANLALAKEIADFCKRNVDRLEFPVKTLCYELLHAMVFGVKLAEKVYEPGAGDDAGRLMLKTIRVKRNASWNFVVAPTGDVVAIQALTFDAGLRDLPPEKFLIVKWMPRDGDPRGRSVLRTAYNAWNLKINLFPRYFKYLDKFASPTIVGVAAPDARDEPELDDNGRPTGRDLTPTEAMAQMLSRLEGGSYAALPPGSTLHTLRPAGNGAAFLQAFDFFKTEIVESILFNARQIMQAKHSSKADVSTGQDTVGQILLYGRETLEDAFHTQLFRQLVALNWGEAIADLYTPHVSLGSVEHQDVSKVAIAYAQLGYQIDPATQSPTIDAQLNLPVRRPTAVDVGESDGNPAEFASGALMGPPALSP